MYFPPVNNSEQITKDPTLRAIKPWWVILIGAVILYLLPAKELFELPLIGAALNWLASLIPSIERWVELSPFPYNTKLFAVFVWGMIPIQIYWLVSSGALRSALRVDQREKSVQRSIWMQIMALLQFGIFLCAFVLIPWNFAIVDTPPCRVCVNTVPWAQLLIGSAFSLTASGLFALLATVFPLPFKSFIAKGNDHV